MIIYLHFYDYAFKDSRRYNKQTWIHQYTNTDSFAYFSRLFDHFQRVNQSNNKEKAEADISVRTTPCKLI